jgi:hypothetical protein
VLLFSFSPVINVPVVAILALPPLVYARSLLTEPRDTPLASVAIHHPARDTAR